jgi:hypothetical protein
MNNIYNSNVIYVFACAWNEAFALNEEHEPQLYENKYDNVSILGANSLGS